MKSFLFTGYITKHDSVLLQFTTARIITFYDNMLLQFTTGMLLQFTTLVITFHDSTDVTSFFCRAELSSEIRHDKSTAEARRLNGTFLLEL